ncbi:Glucose-6-phosphate/phosphate translocator 2 [Zea mays]|uniref:Glucose-6-phosphate/phosphate translocator 2 n=1 Tax=Zea mays TaxID=4577 RepID=A0A1D6IDP6_MAIZE|nr:Glucose-6-phosphate/phosphate translocator 2 [Zea mays]
MLFSDETPRTRQPIPIPSHPSLFHNHQERGAGIQRARLQVLPRRALPGAGLLLPPPHHRRMRARRRHRAQLQHGWIHGGNDLQPGIRRPDHLLQEGDEGQVRERDELLRLPLHHVAGDPPALRRRHGGAQGVGSGLADSSRRDRSQLRLVGGGAERVLPPVQPGVLHVPGRDLAPHLLHRQHHEAHLRHRRVHHHLPDARPAHQRARGRHRHPRNLHLLPGQAVAALGARVWLSGLSSVHRRISSALEDITDYITFEDIYLACIIVLLLDPLFFFSYFLFS